MTGQILVDRATIEQALEAMLNFPDDISDEMFESIRALRAALAQQPEPVPDIDGGAVSEGMTLRDYFAAKTMQGLLDAAMGKSEIAKVAYEMADAMLAARQA